MSALRYSSVTLAKANGSTYGVRSICWRLLHGTIFRLDDGSKPLDIPVEGTVSALLDEKFWLHSIYWETTELENALIQAFGWTHSIF